MTSINTKTSDNDKRKKIMYDYLEYICSKTSCHGANWFQSIKSHKLRVPFLIICFNCQVLVFVLFINGLFFQDLQIRTTTSWFNNDNVSMPYITVCNPRMFDTKEAESKWSTSC
jgi:hypothetical protein